MKSITRNKGNNTLVLSSGIISVAFIIIWTLMTSGHDPARAWRALLINYLFFSSAAAGLVVWPAIVVVCEGEWMGPLEKFCRLGLAASIPSVVALIALWTGSEHWAPWLNVEGHKLWFNNTFLFSRNLAFLILFWLASLYFIRNRYTKKNVTASVLLILIYAITFSLAGFDFVMGLNPEWHSMMMGGYIFIGGLYTAATAWAFISVLSGRPDKRSLIDINKLIVTFSLITMYLMFSQLLPIWYENLPEETTYLVPLMNLAWKQMSYVVIFIVYLGPLILLMTKWSKSNYFYVGIVTLILLAGLWFEKWWLVSSVFERNTVRFGWIEIFPALAFLAAIISGAPVAMNFTPEKT